MDIAIIPNHMHQGLNVVGTDVIKSLLLLGVVGNAFRACFVFQQPARLAHNRRRTGFLDYTALEGMEIALTVIRDQSGSISCDPRI